ncbi:MAG: Jag N-terminal domain-containing protein [Euzebyaceae bacterium]|jgi:spoIIIJ-associated protein|nr:Jag N-terminal domain-containing protein [Euzebyaceae bacterium]
MPNGPAGTAGEARQVQVTGATISEAVAAALAQLGVSQDAVDIEVVAEPRRGFFGSPKPAVVRVTRKAPLPPPVAPQTSSRTETQEDHVMTETDSGPQVSLANSEAPSAEERMNQLDEEAELAADFVEGLLDLLDLPGDLEIEIQEDQALVNLEDVGSGLLIGRRGATLDALQELVRCAVQRQTERRSQVRVDVEGYRGRHVEKLRDHCREAIAEVRESGNPVRLDPMDAYERKLMHDLVAKTGGVTSSSEGTEPKRRVVIQPDEG